MVGLARRQRRAGDLEAWFVRKKRFSAQFALVLIAALFVLVFAGCGGSGGNGGSTRNSSVKGIVRDSTNGDEPVEGASITIGGVTATTRTRDNANADNPVGSFEIINPAVGAEAATITPIGGTAQQVAFEPPITTGINAELELFINIGQVRGRVILPNGQVAATARVTASATGEQREVNTNGTFLLQFIPVGDTEIFAVQGTATARRTVTITPGLNAIGDIQLVDDPNPNPPAPPRTLFGKVTLQGLGNVANVTVLLFRNGTQIESSFTDAQGNYEFYVPAGNYTIRAGSAGFQDASQDVTLTDPANPREINLTLVP